MTPDDLDDMAALLGDPQVMRYYPRPKRRQEALAWIAWNQRLYHQHGVGLWLPTLRDTGEFVGDCGLSPQQVDGVTELEVGYHIGVALQGRGVATEAAAACRDHARDVLGVDRHHRPAQPALSAGRGKARPGGGAGQRPSGPLARRRRGTACRTCSQRPQARRVIDLGYPTRSCWGAGG
jgi:Acetyltransferase (GNAT) domain